jgi:hypothetical protein
MAQIHMMNDTACLDKLRQIDEDLQKEYEEIRKKRDAKKKEVLKEWAESNARFSIGDIIESYDNIIIVDNISGDISGKLYCVYRGPVLTKQLKPRKDGERKTFYDDGRHIRLVRHNKE